MRTNRDAYCNPEFLLMPASTAEIKTASAVK